MVPECFTTHVPALFLHASFESPTSMVPERPRSHVPDLVLHACLFESQAPMVPQMCQKHPLASDAFVALTMKSVRKAAQGTVKIEYRIPVSRQ